MESKHTAATEMDSQKAARPPSPVTPAPSMLLSSSTTKAVVPTQGRAKRQRRKRHKQRRNTVFINDDNNRNVSKTVKRTNKTTYSESRYSKSPGPHMRNIRINKSTRTTETRVQGNVSEEHKNDCCSCFGSCVFHDNKVNNQASA